MPPDASGAPFAIGDRVIIAGAPEHGSLIVRSVDWHPAGSWRVTAGDASGYRLTMAAEGFCRMPPGWCEPPVIPTTIALVQHDDAARYEPRPDPEALPLWQEQMSRWLAKFSGRP